MAFALTTAGAVDNVYPPVAPPPLQQVLTTKQCRASRTVVCGICSEEIANRWVATFRIPTSGLVGIVGVCPVLCTGKLPPALGAPDQITPWAVVKPLHTYTLWLNSVRAIVRVPLAPSPRAKLHCREPSPRGGKRDDHCPHE